MPKIKPDSGKGSAAPPRFFVDMPLHEATVELPREVAHHALTVLRLKSGSPLRLFNGHGGQWYGHLDTGRFVVLHHYEPDDLDACVEIHLAQALVANEKLDWIIEKAVELGVSSIHLIAADRSTVRLAKDRLQKRQHHWQSIVRSACAQCGRNRTATLHWHESAQSMFAPLPSALNSATMPDKVAEATVRAVLIPGASTALASTFAVLAASALGDVNPQRHSIWLAIGPEGGWTESECAIAIAAGWQTVHLGRRVLRTETAGLAAIAAVQSFIGDFADQRS